VITLLLLSGFAVTYYFGPDVEQKFKLITPGSVAGVIILATASMGFRLYVANFGDYGASYGSLGAVIILMLWLYIMGFVLLLGSEVDTLTERFALKEKKEEEKEPGLRWERRPVAAEAIARAEKRESPGWLERHGSGIMAGTALVFLFIRGKASLRRRGRRGLRSSRFGL